MAEKSSGLVRSVTAQLRRYARGGGRFLRRGRRYEARLPFVVSLLDTSRGRVRYLPDAPALVGYTRDLSETGLTLLLPSVRVGEAYLTDGGCRLEVKLELPGGAITVLATSVRFEQLAREEAGCGFLLAVSIVEMKEAERQRYSKFLKTAAGKETRNPEGRKAQASSSAPGGSAQRGAWDALTPASVDQAFEQFLRK